ncbi:hypothetical protein E2562_039153 [Oryza meyeriana var. granulata]|uniref:Uncharacterized protein n=1 Tax=Oryza meyeriana var. granulata TaxID=110450 RepID=A0A6G1CBM5_9ORYZ|nr:hypothetical protein E2562_039153 [Oryza meyeriana var. granulata]
MVPDAKASGSSRPRDGEASRAGEASPMAWLVPVEGDACSPPSRKQKMTVTPERRQFAARRGWLAVGLYRSQSQSKEAGLALGPEAPSSLGVGEAEAVATPRRPTYPPGGGSP